MASLIEEPWRPRKKWRVSWRERGRHRTKRFATKRAAESFIGDIAKGQSRPDASRITLADWLEMWLTGHGVAWQPRTQDDRAAYSERLIEPHLGHLRLAEVGRADIRRWQRTLIAEGKTPYTVNRVVQVLSAAMGAAVDDDLIAVNPCRGVRPIPRQPKRREAATADELEAVRAHMESARDRLMVSLMAYGGLRPSEVRALSWADVAGHTLTVRAALADDGTVKTTKTGGVRTVPVIAPLADDLAALGRGEGLVITGPHLERHNWIRRVWHPAREAAGVRAELVPYSLRHTYASLLIAAGRNPWQVAHLMGHSTPEMVIRTYGHLFAEAEHAEPKELEAVAIEARQRAASALMRASARV